MKAKAMSIFVIMMEEFGWFLFFRAAERHFKMTTNEAGRTGHHFAFFHALSRRLTRGPGFEEGERRSKLRKNARPGFVGPGPSRFAGPARVPARHRLAAGF